MSLRRRERFTIRRLELEPGDVLVFETDDRLASEQIEAIRAHVTDMAPGVRVMLVSRMRLRAVLGWRLNFRRQIEIFDRKEAA